MQSKYTYNHFYEAGYNSGWAIGKNGKQFLLEQDMLDCLAVSVMAIVAYKKGYDEGFKLGILNGERDAKIHVRRD